MRSNRSTAVAVTAVSLLLAAAASRAASVDMKDPRRAVGREDDIRIDAQLRQDTLSASSALGVTYQVENLTQKPIAIADKIVDVTYDAETQTVLFTIGSEVPSATMPHIVTIAPGDKRVLTAGGMLHVNVPHMRSPFLATPRSVQIKVNVLRDPAPFQNVAVQQPMSGALFDRWVEASDSIYCNPIPVTWRAGGAPSVTAAEARDVPEVSQGNW